MGRQGSGTVLCVSCGSRIRREQPYVGIEDYDTGRELPYHAHEGCREVLAEFLTDGTNRGKLFFLHHYHTCNDHGSGFECWAGCFKEPVMN